MVELEIINPMNYEGWDDLLISNQVHEFFHSSIWARVLYESYRYHPVYFVLFSDHNLSILIPVMEVRSFLTGSRGVSLPFSDYVTPIMDGRIPSQDILADILQYGRRAGWKFLELRDGGSFDRDIPPSRSYYVHRLDLTQNEGHLFSSFRSSTRRNIRKAAREKVEVDICHSLESVNEFYRLNCLTRKHHGIPPQPYSFFRSVFRHVISKYHGFVALASHRRRTIAGAVFFHFGKKAMYKYGASDRRYQHLRANNLLLWEAIRWYSKNGYRELSFGITDPANKGLLRFKNEFCPKVEKIQYHKYDLRKGDFVTEKSRYDGFHTDIFERLPIPWSRAMGSLLYRHMG